MVNANVKFQVSSKTQNNASPVGMEEVKKLSVTLNKITWIQNSRTDSNLLC